LKLALDTSQSSGSIALLEAGKLLYSAYFDIRVTHSETLMPALDNALKICGKSPGDLDELLVCIGPGSFTGLRIGLATIKGIAYGLGLSVTAYNSLQLSALPCTISGKNILSVIDARMHEVYAALYLPDLGIIQAPKVLSPINILSWDLKAAIITGSGAGIIRKVLEAEGIKAEYAPAYFCIPRAEGLFSLADLLPSPSYEGESLSELVPLYLRESTAQVKRQQKLST
jgi:tRNA threonylcarbamoyladenosine biosynthesis protein TsaB